MTHVSSTEAMSQAALPRWLRRSALLVPGVAVFALVLAAPSLRRPDGWLEPWAWTGAVAGLSLGLVGATWLTRWRECGAMLGLALVGQACALGLKHSPPYNLLEHYSPWQEILTSPKGLLLLGPLAQTIGVAVVTWRRRRALLGRALRLLTPAQALVVVGVMVFAASNGSWELGRYVAELGLSLWVSAVNLLNLALAAAAVPAHFLDRTAAWLRRGFASPGWNRALPWTVAAGVTAICATLACLVFERVPHIPDDISYLFQAKYFAAGRVYLPAPPDAASFSIDQTVNDGTKWYAYGSPAWPAVLALGLLAGVPWLMNPLLCGTTVVMAHALLRRYYDRPFAHASILLLAASPWFLFMGGSFLTHPFSLVLTLGTLLAVWQARETDAAGWAAVAGACLGALFLTRPLEALLLAAPIGIWLLVERLSRRALLAFTIAAALVAGLVLPYNRMLTGDPVRFPIDAFTDQAWYPGANRLGFGPDVGNVGWSHLDPLPGHGPLDVVINANQNVYMSNADLFGWAFGSLLFVALLVVWRRWTRTDRLMLGIVAAVVTGHSLYWFSGGPDIGARYWYQALIPLVVLTARGVQELQRRWLASGGTQLGGLRITAFVVAASLIAAVNVIPWRSLGKYHRYRGVRADLARLADEHRFGRALVFVRERDTSDYRSAFIFNPPTLTENAPVFARELSPQQRERVQRAYADRPVWVVAAGAEPDHLFRVVAGPLPALGSLPTLPAPDTADPRS